MHNLDDIPTDERTLVEYLVTQGYLFFRKMPNGDLAGVTKFLFTYGIVTKLHWYGYDGQRYCYNHFEDALKGLLLWDKFEGDPPGPWIKTKGFVERHNPKLYTIKAIKGDGSEWAVRNDTPETATW